MLDGPGAMTIQALSTQLRDGIDPSLPLYLLVDPLVGEPVPGITPQQDDPAPQRAHAWERHVIPVPLARNVPLPPRQHPYLLRLHGADDRLLESTMELAQQEHLAAQSGGLDGRGGAAHAIAGWLQSAMPEAELAAALSKMCRINTFAATRATYLRLADRRVLDLVCHVVGEPRVAAQLGRIHSWTYLDPMGQLRCLRRAQAHGEVLRLSVPEWRRLGRGERLQRTLATCLGALAEGPQPLPPLDYDAVEKAVIGAELAAKKWPHRFAGSRDEITWAALSICHPALPQSAQVHALMAGTGSPDDPPEPVCYLYGELRALLERAEAGAASVSS